MEESKKTDIKWICEPFNQLTPIEIYKIMQLRNAVFGVEQNCVYLDADDKDQVSFHFCGWHNDTLAAYTRLMPANIDYPEISIGRVVTNIHYRKNGIGKLLMQHSIEQCFSLFGRQSIKIGAQIYLKKFYESFGFQQVSDIYLEDGIEHIKMQLLV